MIRSSIIRLNKNINPKILSNLSRALKSDSSNNSIENQDIIDNNNNDIDNSSNNINNNNIISDNNNNDNNNNNSTITKKLSSKERNILLRKSQREKNKIIKQDLSKNIKNELDTTILMDKVSLALPRCSGCGCSLQTHNPKEPGFIPESVALKHMDALNKVSENDQKLSKKEKKQKKKDKEIQEIESNRVSILDVDIDDDGGEQYFENFFKVKKLNKNKENKICQRCHLLKNYGKIAPVSIPIEKFKKNLSKLKDLNCVIVKVVDLMDFHGTFIEDFRDIVGNNPVIIVGNKMDLLPSDIHKDRIENWLTSEAKAKGLAHVSHVLLLSSINKDGMKQFIIELEKIRRGRDVFVVGCSNVGKSTFVNSLVDEYNAKVEFIYQQQQQSKNEHQEEKKKKLSIQEQKELEREKLLRSIQSKITTSILPGTTLNLLSLPLWKDSTLFDTPGIDNPRQMLKLLSLDELKQVLPSKRIKPTLVHMIDGKTLFIGGMIRIDYSGPLSTFLVYTSNSIPLHLTSTKKADKLFAKQQGRLLTPPILSNNINNNNNNNNNNSNNQNSIDSSISDEFEDNISSEIFNIINSSKVNENEKEDDNDAIIEEIEEKYQEKRRIDRTSEEVVIDDYDAIKDKFKLKRNSNKQQETQEEKENDQEEEEIQDYNKDLSPLDLEKLEKFKLEQIKSFTIRSDKVDFKHTRCDLVLSGIGWISIKPLSKKLISPRLLVHSPKNIDVNIRNQPLIPLTNSTVNILK